MARPGPWALGCLALLGGCPAADPPQVDEAVRAEAEAAAKPAAVESLPELRDDGLAIGVEIVFVGVGHLHQTFFGDEQLRQRLGAELDGLVTDPARIRVGFDSEEHLGTITLELPPEGLRVQVERQGDALRLDQLAPLTVALANYRDALGARFDIELFSARGVTGCTLGITGGNPPDGRTVSPCVLINGQESCGRPTAEGTVFAPEIAAALAECLDL